MKEFVEIPLDAQPTVRDASRIIGVSKRVVRRYMNSEDYDSRLHPNDVLGVAEKVHAEGNLRRPFNEIAMNLINHARRQCPEADPLVTEVADEFLTHLHQRALIGYEPEVQQARRMLGHFSVWR